MAKRLTDHQVRQAIIEFLAVTKKHQYFKSEKHRYISASAAEIARAVHVSKKRAEGILHSLNEEFDVYARMGQRYTIKYSWATEEQRKTMKKKFEDHQRYERLCSAAKSVGLDIGHRGSISMSMDTFETLLRAYEDSL